MDIGDLQLVPILITFALAAFWLIALIVLSRRRRR